MRRSILIATLGAAILASSAQGAVLGPRSANSEALSLRWGRGLAVVGARGAILGTLRRGRLVVTIPKGSTAVATVYGAEYKKKLSARRTLYRGYGLRYHVFHGRWRVRIVGRGVNASAAGEGWFGLDGTRGQYAVGGGAYKRWPSVYRTFSLGG
jgi:hypothetical protein